MNSEELLRAIEIIANSKVENLKFDKTIEANISSVIDYSKGEYQISFNGNAFNVFSENNKIYEIGDSVLVKVPEGDFSKKKIIQSKTSASANTETLKEFIVKGESINNIYNINNNKEGSTLDSLVHTIWERESTDLTAADTLFTNYANNYDKIKISANFQTLLKGNHNKGNYGIIVTFGQRDGKTVAYRLDTNNFTGGIYSFQNPSPQEIVFSFQKGSLVSLQKIEFFNEQFEIDLYQTWDNETEQLIQRINSDPCLFVSDINLSFVEEKDYSQEPYYLSILAPSGLSVREGYSVILKPSLKYYGKNILSNSTCKWHWYEEKIIDNNATTQWIEVSHYEPGSNLNLLVSANEVKYKTRYKFEITYNNNITLSEYITVKNNSNINYYNLIQNNNLLSLESNDDDIEIFWYYEDNDKKIQFIQEGKEIDITNYLTAIQVNFFCVVKDICTLNKTINNLSSGEQINVLFKGIDTYQYDINGDFNIDEAQIERSLEANVVLADGFVSGYKEEWIVPEQNTMIREYQISEGILYYKVKQKFSKRDTNNTVIYRIIGIDGQYYDFEKELFFLKDGDQAVTGDTYSCIVRPSEDSNTALNYNNGAWGEGMKLQAIVYKGNDLVTSDIKYEWTGVGVTCTGSAAEVQITGLGDPNTNIQFIVKLKVMVDNNTIYYNYPVNIIIGEPIDESKLKISLPNQIVYSKSGLAANHTSDPAKIIYNSTDVTDELAAANNLLTIVNKEDGKYIEPISSFQYNSNETGVLYCQLTPASKLLHPVMMTLDTSGNEALDGWDGTQIQINDNTTITAPQAGSSTVTENKTVTGVILGTENKTSQDTTTSSTGLYGYKDGVNTFALKEDGTASFGSEDKGQILIDGNNSKISGGGEFENESMTLYLVKPTSGEAITVGSYFKVRYDGSIDAQEGKIGALLLKDGVLSTEDGNTKIHKEGISAKSFSVINDNDQNIGTLGRFDGNDGEVETNVVGIQATKNSIVFDSVEEHIRLSAKKDIWFEYDNGKKISLSALISKIDSLTN